MFRSPPQPVCRCCPSSPPIIGFDVPVRHIDSCLSSNNICQQTVEDTTGVARPLHFAADKVYRWLPPYRDVRQRQTHQNPTPLARYRSYLPVQTRTIIGYENIFAHRSSDLSPVAQWLKLELKQINVRVKVAPDSACSNQKMNCFEVQKQRKKRKCKICQRIVDHDNRNSPYTYGMDDDFDGNECDNDDGNILDEKTFEHGQSCNVEEGTGYSASARIKELEKLEERKCQKLGKDQTKNGQEKP
ncbi:hypothetical protein LXL04_029428 [Taraxacum kok-saghyz]